MTRPSTPSQPGLWAFTDHACRMCRGRILVRMDGAACGIVHRCSICEVECTGPVEDVCACGTRNPDGSDTRLYCTRPPEEWLKHGNMPAIVIMRREPDAIDRLLSKQEALPIRQSDGKRAST